MQVQSKCEDATKKVREHIKTYKEQSRKVEKHFDEFESSF